MFATEQGFRWSLQGDPWRYLTVSPDNPMPGENLLWDENSQVALKF
jgi:hypothetical protein